MLLHTANKRYVWLQKMCVCVCVRVGVWVGFTRHCVCHCERTVYGIYVCTRACTQSHSRARTHLYTGADDIYPVKRERPKDRPCAPSEQTLPSCNNSDAYLTPDEVGDLDLVKGFILDRWNVTWPCSGWGALWSVYRAAYSVGMSMVIIIFIAHVWKHEDSDFESVEKQMRLDNKSIIWAFWLSGGAVLATVVQSCTETWVVENAKFGLTGKQLRDSIVAQVLWADDGRLGLMRAADYLNAATQEVEAAAACYEQVFPAIERFAHVVFELIKILYLFRNSYLLFVAFPLVLSIIPMTICIQWMRSARTRELLDTRQQHERQYVSTLSDIIENTHTFRSLPTIALTIRQQFAQDTQNFSRAHLEAVKFNVTTKENIELLQGFMLAGIFFTTCLMVNSGSMTQAQAVGIISAFIAGSADVIELSAIALKMKFCTEGLRMVTRIMNYPTDAHSLAESFNSKRTITEEYMSTPTNAFAPASARPTVTPHSPASEASAKRGAHLKNCQSVRRHLKINLEGRYLGQVQDGTVEDEDPMAIAHSCDNTSCLANGQDEAGLEWANRVELKNLKWQCSARTALRGARHNEQELQRQQAEEARICITDEKANHKRRKHDIPFAQSFSVSNSMLMRAVSACKGEGEAPAVHISCSFRLGGVKLLVAPTSEDADITLRLIAGVIITDPRNAAGRMYVPPFLSYAYVGETPVLVEGSILKNLMLGVKNSKSHAELTSKMAWEIAHKCGLPDEYMCTPETFSVGKSGRNLPMIVRQVISLARAILSDACVLMCHKPIALLPAPQGAQVLQVLANYVALGGVWGLLQNKEIAHGPGPHDFLTGQGTRTVIMTLGDRDDPVPSIVQQVIHVSSSWECERGAHQHGASVDHLSVAGQRGREMPQAHASSRPTWGFHETQGTPTTFSTRGVV